MADPKKKKRDPLADELARAASGRSSPGVAPSLAADMAAAGRTAQATMARRPAPVPPPAPARPDPLTAELRAAAEDQKRRAATALRMQQEAQKALQTGDQAKAAYYRDQARRAQVEPDRAEIVKGAIAGSRGVASSTGGFQQALGGVLRRASEAGLDPSSNSDATGRFLARGLGKYARALDKQGARLEERYSREAVDLAPEVDSFKKIGGLRDAAKYGAYQVGSAAASMAPSIVAGALTGGVGAVAPAYAQMTGEARRAMVEQGADPDRANAASMALGVPLAALEAVTPGKLSARAVGKLAGKVATPGGVLKRTLKGAGRSALEEGETEALQQGLTGVGAAVTAGKPVEWRKLGDQMLEAGVAGAVGGGALGGAVGALPNVSRETPAAPYDPMQDPALEGVPPAIRLAADDAPNIRQRVIQRQRAVDTAEGVINQGYRDEEAWTRKMKETYGEGAWSDEDLSAIREEAVIRLLNRPAAPQPVGPGSLSTVDVATKLAARSGKPLPVGQARPQDRARRFARLAMPNAIEAIRTVGSGRNWYKADIEQHDDFVKTLFPETAEPPKLAIWKAILAVTSNGQKPPENFSHAASLYAHYRRTGQLTTDQTKADVQSAARWRSMEPGLQRVQALIAERGEEAAMDFLLNGVVFKPTREFAPGSNLETGKTGKVRTTRTVPAAVELLGPKIGRFFLNVNGRPDHTTVDRWAIRTHRRLMGTAGQHLRPRRTEVLDPATGQATFVPAIGPDGRPTMELDDAASPEELAEIRRDFTTLSEALTRETGMKMDPADVQALFWYYEKDLYAREGARESGMDSFADAAAQFYSGFRQAPQQVPQATEEDFPDVFNRLAAGFDFGPEPGGNEPGDPGGGAGAAYPPPDAYEDAAGDLADPGAGGGPLTLRSDAAAPLRRPGVPGITPRAPDQRRAAPVARDLSRAPFYSRLRRAIEAAPFAKPKPVDQWMAQIRKGGVPQEELTYTTIEAQLREAGRDLTKEEVLAIHDQVGVKMAPSELVLGRDAMPMAPEVLEYMEQQRAMSNRLANAAWALDKAKRALGNDSLASVANYVDQTRRYLLDHLVDYGLRDRVREVLQGLQAGSITPEDVGQIVRDRWDEEARDASPTRPAESTTKQWAKFAQGYAETYRKALDKLQLAISPGRAAELKAMQDEVASARAEHDRLLAEMKASRNEEYESAILAHGKGPPTTQYESYYLPEATNPQEFLIHLPVKGDQRWEAGHFGAQGKDLLAHLLTSERVAHEDGAPDAESYAEDGPGERATFFIEEAQSDLQQARQPDRDREAEGARVTVVGHEVLPLLPHLLTPERVIPQDTTKLPEGWVVDPNPAYDPQDPYQGDRFSISRIAIEQGTKRRIPRYMGSAKTEAEAVKLARRKARDEGWVPELPYAETVEWTKLLVRRAILEAIEGGYHRVAWARGDQIASKPAYNAAKHITAARYDADKEHLVALNGNQVVFDSTRDAPNGRIKPNELAAFIGKELADRLLDGPIEERPNPTAKPSPLDYVGDIPRPGWVQRRTEELEAEVNAQGGMGSLGGDSKLKVELLAVRGLRNVYRSAGLYNARADEGPNDTEIAFDDWWHRSRTLDETMATWFAEAVGGKAQRAKPPTIKARYIEGAGLVSNNKGFRTYYDGTLPEAVKAVGKELGVKIDLEPVTFDGVNDHLPKPTGNTSTQLGQYYSGPEVTAEAIEAARDRAQLARDQYVVDKEDGEWSQDGDVGLEALEARLNALQKAAHLAQTWEKSPVRKDAWKNLQGWVFGNMIHGQAEVVARALGGRLDIPETPKNLSFVVTPELVEAVDTKGLRLREESEGPNLRRDLVAPPTYGNVELVSFNNPAMKDFPKLEPQERARYVREAARRIVVPIARSEGLDPEVAEGLGSWFSEGDLSVNEADRLAFPPGTPEPVIRRVMARVSKAMQQSGYFVARFDPQGTRQAVEIDFGRAMTPEEYRGVLETISRDVGAPTGAFNGSTMISLSQPTARVQIVLNEGADVDATKAALARALTDLETEGSAAITSYPVTTLENFDAGTFDQDVEAGGPLTREQQRVDREARRAYGRLARLVKGRLRERFPRLEDSASSPSARKTVADLVASGAIDAEARPEAPAIAAEALTRLDLAESAIGLRGKTSLWKTLSTAINKTVAHELRELRAGRVANLRGLEIQSAGDLAVALQVMRDPGMEHFSLILTKGDKIVRVGITSSRLPGAVAPWPKEVQVGDGDGFARWVAEIAKQEGADGVWMSHNHPAGNPRSSQPDRSTTRYLHNHPALRGLIRGHIIIDSGTYSYCGPDGTNWHEHIELPGQRLQGPEQRYSWDRVGHELTAKDPLWTPEEAPKGIVGQIINDVVQATTQFLHAFPAHDPKVVTALWINGRGRLVEASEISADMLTAITLRQATNQIREKARDVGAVNVILVSNSNQAAWKRVEELQKSGVIAGGFDYAGPATKRAGLPYIRVSREQPPKWVVQRVMDPFDNGNSVWFGLDMRKQSNTPSGGYIFRDIGRPREERLARVEEVIRRLNRAYNVGSPDSYQKLAEVDEIVPAHIQAQDSGVQMRWIMGRMQQYWKLRDELKRDEPGVRVLGGKKKPNPLETQLGGPVERIEVDARMPARDPAVPLSATDRLRQVRDTIKQLREFQAASRYMVDNAYDLEQDPEAMARAKARWTEALDALPPNERAVINNRQGGYAAHWLKTNDRLRELEAIEKRLRGDPGPNLGFQDEGERRAPGIRKTMFPSGVPPENPPGGPPDFSGAATTGAEGPHGPQPERKADLVDKILTGFRAVLLASFRTHELNALGNTVMAGAETMKDPLATGLDILVSKITGRRTKSASVYGLVGAQGQSLWRALQPGGAFREALASKKTQEAVSKDILALGVDKETAEKYDIRQRTFDSDLLQAAVDVIFKPLGATDAVFRSAAFGRALVERARVHILNYAGPDKPKTKAEFNDALEKMLANPHPMLVAAAIMDAEIATFQDPNYLARGVQKFMKESEGKVWGRLAFGLLMPFVKTPLNVAGRFIDYSPLGFLTAVLKHAGVPVGKQKWSDDRQKELVEDLSRATMGLPWWALGVYLAAEGLATGMYPDDDEERRQWEQQGKAEFALRLGDRWVPVGRLGPLGTMMGLGAQYYANLTRRREGIDESEGASQGWALGENVGNVVQMTGEQTFLKGIGEAIANTKSIGSMGRSFRQTASSYFSIPLVRQALQGVDTKVRDPEGWVQESVTKNWWPQGMAPKHRPLGESVEKVGGVLGLLKEVFDPLGVRKANDDPVAIELQEIGVPIPGVSWTVPDSAKKKGERKRTETEGRALKVDRGPVVRAGLSALFSDPRYQALGVEEKQAASGAVLSAIATVANERERERLGQKLTGRSRGWPEPMDLVESAMERVAEDRRRAEEAPKLERVRAASRAGAEDPVELGVELGLDERTAERAAADTVSGEAKAAKTRQLRAYGDAVARDDWDAAQAALEVLDSLGIDVTEGEITAAETRRQRVQRYVPRGP